jgi:hypothetical protein
MCGWDGGFAACHLRPCRLTQDYRRRFPGRPLPPDRHPAVAQRLGDMQPPHRFVGVEIGQGSRHSEDAVIAARSLRGGASCPRGRAMRSRRAARHRPRRWCGCGARPATPRSAISGGRARRRCGARPGPSPRRAAAGRDRTPSPPRPRYGDRCGRRAGRRSWPGSHTQARPVQPRGECGRGEAIMLGLGEPGQSDTSSVLRPKEFVRYRTKRRTLLPIRLQMG